MAVLALTHVTVYAVSDIRRVQRSVLAAAVEDDVQDALREAGDGSARASTHVNSV
jgi:hypothetical protein